LELVQLSYEQGYRLRPGKISGLVRNDLIRARHVDSVREYFEQNDGLLVLETPSAQAACICSLELQKFMKFFPPRFIHLFTLCDASYALHSCTATRLATKTGDQRSPETVHHEIAIQIRIAARFEMESYYISVNLDNDHRGVDLMLVQHVDLEILFDLCAREQCCVEKRARKLMHLEI
jgi:hypothetical protein